MLSHARGNVTVGRLAGWLTAAIKYCLVHLAWSTGDYSLIELSGVKRVQAARMVPAFAGLISANVHAIDLPPAVLPPPQPL